jgi:hypothetical protein
MGAIVVRPATAEAGAATVAVRIAHPATEAAIRRVVTLLEAAVVTLAEAAIRVRAATPAEAAITRSLSKLM